MANTSKPQSMTGFGSAQVASDAYEVRCDIRSVNGKGLDVKLRVPTGLEALEQPIKKRVGQAIARGNVQISINVDTARADGGLSIDQELLADLHHQSVQAAEKLGIAAPTLDALLSVRGVITSDDAGVRFDANDDGLADAVFVAVDQALVQFKAAREAEGAALVGILGEQLDATEQLVMQAEADDDSQPEAIKARFAAQLAELLDDNASIDPQRVAGEIAVLITKADIREEIDRLKTHIEAGRALLIDGDTIGRRLDFLIQEFNREANTLCSKSSSKGLTAIGLEMKAVIDQMREQVQNLQ